jgi:acylphosphatase
MKVTTKRLTIRGQVQGVFYRAWSREQADRLELRGWVRNRRDGSVEMLVQGEEEEVEKMIASCRQGPPAARVESIDIEEGEEEEVGDRFEKRPTL